MDLPVGVACGGVRHGRAPGLGATSIPAILHAGVGERAVHVERCSGAVDVANALRMGIAVSVDVEGIARTEGQPDALARLEGCLNVQQVRVAVCPIVPRAHHPSK